MKEVTLPSGAVLKIGKIPFDAANNLKKAVVGIIQGISFEKGREALDLYKEHLCGLFSNEEVEAKLWICMERCTYNSGNGDLKITKATFESEEARGDFTEVQMEVGLACLTPFGKGLYALLQRMLAMGESVSQKPGS